MDGPAKVDGWNVAHMGGGMLFSSDDFIVQFSKDQVSKFITILNSGQPGKIRANNGDAVLVALNKANVILTRVNDPVYPHGIILPVDAFSDFQEHTAPTDAPQPVPVAENLVEGKHKFRMHAGRIVHSFKISTGSKKFVNALRGVGAVSCTRIDPDNDGDNDAPGVADADAGAASAPA